MKNLILLSTFALFFSASLQAQTFSFQRTDPPVVYDSLKSLEIMNHATVTNLTGNGFYITFRLTFNLPSLWGSGVCTWHLCYGPGQDSVTEFCGPGQQLMYVYFYPDTLTPGVGYTTVIAKKTSNPSESYTVTFGAGTWPLGIIKLSNTIKGFELGQNYPNPFNPTTKIKFSIDKANFVDLRLYDILGREVKALLTQYLGPGEYEIEFEAVNLASGMYYYRLRSGENVAVKKMTLVK